LFGFERNMYDRVGHFIIWFYAFPIIELLDRKKWWMIKWYYIYSDFYLWFL
jgi:putative membrane protein